MESAPRQIGDGGGYIGRQCRRRLRRSQADVQVDRLRVTTAAAPNETRPRQGSPMAIRSKLHTTVFAACLAWAVATGTAHAQEVPVVTGEQWSQSTEQVKKAYLVGIANLLQVELAYQAANPPAATQSLIPRAGKGLQGQTLDSVRQKLDSWYTANPNRMQRPVLETLWFEIVVPGSPKAK
jgi:hypothetical protein